MHKIEIVEKQKATTFIGKVKGLFRKLKPKVHTVIIYDSDKELPYRHYAKFNKHMAVDCNVGSSIADYDKRQAKAVQFLNAGHTKKAAIELTNQRQCLHNIVECYSPKGMALAVTVYSIDGIVYDSYHENALNEKLDLLDSIGFTKQMVDETVEHVKKKLKKN